MKQIFYEDRRMVFISARSPITSAKNQTIWDYTDMLELLKQFKQFMRAPQGFTLFIRCAEQSTALFKNFIQCFELIKASGGLVHNTQNKYLYIYRYNQWDLPKGKKEKGESIVQAAMREVEEETAINALQIIKALPNTYHFIAKKNTMIVKKCYWFEMETNNINCPCPQTEESITEAVWLSKEEVLSKRAQMFASIAQLSNLYFNEQTQENNSLLPNI
ncbi:MAG: NUDIX domain-containing protein [Bacteroidales bacterium]